MTWRAERINNPFSDPGPTVPESSIKERAPSVFTLCLGIMTESAKKLIDYIFNVLRPTGLKFEQSQPITGAVGLRNDWASLTPDSHFEHPGDPWFHGLRRTGYNGQCFRNNS